MVAEHNGSIDAVSLGEDDLENPWSGGRAEATIRVREEVADRSRARDIVKSRDERQPGSAEREVLAGLVERVTFHNPDSGFCVLRVKARGHRDLVTVVGHAAMVAAGEWITAWVRPEARFLRSGSTGVVPLSRSLLNFGWRTPGLLYEVIYVTPRQQPRRRAEPARPGHRPGAADRGSPGPAGSASPPPPARSPPSVESSGHHASA